MQNENQSELEARSSNYSRPPIVECVVEFRFTSPRTLSEVEDAQKRLSADLPVVAPTRNLTIKVSSDATDQKVINEAIGYRLSSVDGSETILNQTEFLAVAYAAPYPGWIAFSSGALSRFAQYRKASGFASLNRLGLRYINRIDIPIRNPMEMLRIEDYIKAYPHYPEDEFNPLTSFTSQMAFMPNDDGLTAVITVARVPSPVPRHTSLLFDIDVGLIDAVPQRTEDIRTALNKAHVEKNRIFELLMTKKARELFR